MDISRLRLFVDVTRLGSFAAVARERNVDPASISRALADLEREVGARLLHRTTRRLALTQEGAHYLDRIGNLIDELEVATSEVRSGVSRPVGRLRMTASNAFGVTCLAPLIPEFRARYPEISIELMFSDDYLDLAARGLDMAVRFVTEPESGFSARKLFDTVFRVVASPAYLARAAKLNILRT